MDGRLLKQLKHCRLKTYDVSCRLVSLSGDVEENPGSSDHCSADTSSVSLLETRLCELHRTTLDVGGGGAFFFRAVSISHQLCGNPHNYLDVA